MRKIFFGVLLGLIFSCSKKEPANPAFYYWRTQFKLSETEKKCLATNDVKQLFVRYFDVELRHGQPFPVAPIHFSHVVKGQQIIPVVFIKNEVFLSKSTDVADLTTKMLRLIHQINKVNHVAVKEIQLDCDWSLESRDAYMKFLTLIKKQSKLRVSVTIRLHQVKYFKETRVPPVDYGVLMFYNMGQLTAKGTNSIYDISIAKKYLYHLKDYPLKLSIALPIFSWYVHSRAGNVVQLISKLDKKTFENNVNFEVNGNTILVKHNVMFEGFYFQANDQLRLEEISKETLEEMSDLLSDKLSDKPEHILFYDLDYKNIKNYPNESFFKTIATDF